MSLKSIYRFALASVFGLSSIAFAPSLPAQAIITGVGAYACRDGIVMRATEDDLNAIAPKVYYNIPGGPSSEAGVVGEKVVNVTTSDNKVVPTRIFLYWVDTKIKPGLKGSMAAQQASNARYTNFTVNDQCPVLGSIRGVAYEDYNANGVREANEPLLYNAHYKITGGGNWFVCGYVGSDATYGVPVKPGGYSVIPVALPGWRTTTPRINTLVEDFSYASLNNDIGFVRDPRAKGEACNDYNPPSPLPTATALPTLAPSPTRTPRPTRVPRKVVVRRTATATVTVIATATK